jgi:hypothetical protein
MSWKEQVFLMFCVYSNQLTKVVIVYCGYFQHFPTVDLVSECVLLLQDEDAMSKDSPIKESPVDPEGGDTAAEVGYLPTTYNIF